MTFLDKLKTAKLIPKARRHLLNTIQKLDTQNYETLINESFHSTISNSSLNIIVKAYFWASRSIKNCHCLPRSIALYQALHSIGFKVEHKFGVNKSEKSMVAHAWVEHQNIPLNESKDLRQKFTVLHRPK